MKRFWIIWLIVLVGTLVAQAASVNLMPPITTRVENSTGTSVLAGGYVVTCPENTTCGCTSFTSKTTYADSTGLVANTNPVYLNSSGEANIWLDTDNGAYKITVCDRFGNQQRSTNGVVAVKPITVTSTSMWQDTGITPTYINTTQFSAPGDQTSYFNQGRRLRITETVGVQYYSASTATYSAGITTVTVIPDSANLDSGISKVEYSILDSKAGVAGVNTPSTLVQRGTNGKTIVSIESGTIDAVVFSAGVGTAPFSIPTSTTKVTNLNAEMVDGLHSSQSATGGEIPALDADGDLNIVGGELVSASSTTTAFNFGLGRTHGFFGGASSGNVVSNLRFTSSGYKYVQTGVVGRLLSVDGTATAPTFYTAPAGTAGDVATLSGLYTILHSNNTNTGYVSQLTTSTSAVINFGTVAAGDIVSVSALSSSTSLTIPTAFYGQIVSSGTSTIVGGVSYIGMGQTTNGWTGGGSALINVTAGGTLIITASQSHSPLGGGTPTYITGIYGLFLRKN